jgi:anti-sigma B factor antagonist
VTGPPRVDIEDREDVVVARVAGELDIASATRIGEEIAQSVPISARGLVVDLSGLEFIDSSGVSMLFRLVRRLGGRRQSLAVVTPAGAAVARVLEIVDFPKAASMVDSLEEAVNGVRSPTA